VICSASEKEPLTELAQWKDYVEALGHKVELTSWDRFRLTIVAEVGKDQAMVSVKETAFVTRRRKNFFEGAHPALIRADDA
jgi:hypothetical protein